MKRIVILVLMCLSIIGARAQNVSAVPMDVDQRVGQAMNACDWFELARIYEAEHEHISPFLKLYAESLLATYFGRPAEGAMAIERLIGTYGDWLGEGVFGMCFYWGVNQTRMGEYATAAEGVLSKIAKFESRVDTSVIEPILMYVKQWRELAKFDCVNSMERPAEGDVRVPFRVVNLRPEKGDAPQIRFDAKFGAVEQEVVFDTGAGVNVVSDEAAERLGLTMLEIESEVEGIGGTQQGRYAVAERVELGNATLHNVPFYVISIRTGVDSLDRRYMSQLQVVMGVDLVRAMGEVHIDFEHSELFSPREQTLDGDERPNMCSAPSLFEVECEINDERQTVSIDTGAAASNLSSHYFVAHRGQIEREGVLDTLRSAGAGGVRIEQAYALPNVRIAFGDAEYKWDKLMCSTEEDMIWSAGNIGMDCLASFSRVVINARTMRLSVEERN